MGETYPLDIAGRASNLTERMRIVAALGDRPAPAGELTPFDTWKITRLAGKLADKFQQESLHRGLPPEHTEAELVDVLTGYQLRHDEAAELLAEVHSGWLPTYRAALDGFTPAAEPAASWRQFDVYYGRLAKACEPFLAELGRTLDAVLTSLSGQPGKIDHQVVDDLQRHFLDRFELTLAWALEADANVHCARTGVDRAKASREDYLRYLDSTFQDRESYHQFYLRFPVLGRWLARVTKLLGDYGSELIRNLSADSARVGEAFFGQPVTAVRTVRLGNSDYHAGARSVALLEVELADGSAESVYYKPRCLRSEAAMQDLLGRLAGDGVVGFATRPVLPMAGYGYEAAIPSGRNHAESIEQVRQVYRELGGYLAVFYVLGGGDLHFENILVADGHAFVCDGETTLGVLPRGRGRSAGTLLDSVFKTGLLEWPRGVSESDEMRISGYAGGEEYQMPTAVPRVNDRRLSFEAAVVHQSGIQVRPSAANRVFLDGELVRPQEHAADIMAGFDQVYAWFRQRADAADVVSATFDGANARFINWGTQIYSQLLIAARHPKCLTDPIEVDLLANTVRTFPRTWDVEGVLATREVASMWQLDVPIFTTDAHGRQLTHDHREQLPSYLETSPIDYATERIRQLSEANQAQQGQYIAASLATGEVTSESFVSTALDYAVKIGTRLCQMLRDPAADAPWTSYQLLGGKVTGVDIEADLYQGSAGIALFLAYLDDLVPRPEFRQAARRALAHVLRSWDRDRLGTFTGLGGVIYLLTHLGSLWHDQNLLDQAVSLTADLDQRIDRDEHLDVLHGSAGLIPVLLGLAEQTGGQGLDQAHRAAQHLLRHAEAVDGTLSWPSSTSAEATANLTGFSHGAGGVGWALIALGQHTGRAEYVDAGRRAFAYEATHFDSDELDWHDLRKSPGGVPRKGRHFANAWCNGAAGIGLSRIASWAILGGTDEGLLREARQALTATMRNFPKLGNHTLCHGTSGNAELLLRFALLRDEPAFRLEANVQVQSLWRSFDDAEHGIGENSANFFPGLMIGITGFGMHFLRLARPDRVPSALLLDPPSAHL